MKSISKTFLSFFVVITLFFLSYQSFAQPRGMTMSQMSQQAGKLVANQQMEFMQRMRMMNMSGIAGGVLEFDFQVTMLDSTKKEITSAIYIDTIANTRFIVWVDKQYKKSDPNRYKRIYPFQTKSLTWVEVQKNEDNEIPGKYQIGKVTDSCWMFKTTSGSINVYNDMAYNYSRGGYRDTVVGIQLNDGPILPFNEANLKSMVGQNAKALEFISEKKYDRAIKRFNSDSKKSN